MTLTPLRIQNTAPGLAATAYGQGTDTVLLALPLAEERKGVLRPLHDLACRLAEGGWTALLFDYRGSGESPGGFEELTWGHLLADTHAAAATACELSGAQRIHVVAVRLAARIALESLPPEKVAGFVFWEPVLDAANWLNDLRRRSRFRGGGAAVDPLDIDGYRFAPEFANELEVLSGLPPVPSSPTRIACVGRRGEPSRRMRELAQSLRAETAPVIREPFWLETGVVDAGPLLDDTLQWLNERRTPAT